MRKYFVLAIGIWLIIMVGACNSSTGQVSSPKPFALQLSNSIDMSTSTTSDTTRLPIILASVQPNTFIETFNGSPTTPQPWHPDNWDIVVHSRDVDTWVNPQAMQAMHGSDCGAPPATHLISSYDDAVFLCRDHLMTAINAEGYGMIYLTPNQLVDFSTGEAVISWDMSTLRTSGRDWVDLWITPFSLNRELPLQSWLPDLNGPPREAIHISMGLSEETVWGAELFHNYVLTDVPNSSMASWRSFLTESASRRDKLELRISRNHLKFGMPAYNFYWVDTAIPEQSWGQGVVQFGHHSYNPTKSDGCGQICQPNTWHWDNVRISPALPFTLLRANRRTADVTNPTVAFPAPAPQNGYLRFAGIGGNLSVSYDSGKTWQTAQEQLGAEPSVDEHFKSYWMPIPAGISSVQFRADDWWGGTWLIRDISVWALNGT